MGMRYGIVASYGGAAEHVAMARATEEAGWDGFFTWDGISVGPVETWDPWVLLGAAATATERVRLGALVFSPARRRPWKLAREAVTVDHLSRGRLVLPVGLGGDFDGGYTAVSGEARPVRERAERLDETLAILAAAWTGEAFSHHGTHYRVDDLVLAPPPVQRPRIPVWPVAGLGSDRSMARAARWDGAVLQRVGSEEHPGPDAVAEAVRWFAEHRPDGLTGFDVVTQGELPRDRARAADEVAALEAAGATWWVAADWDPARATPEEQLAIIRQGPPRA